MGRRPQRSTGLRALAVVLVALVSSAVACGGSSGSKAKSAPKKEVFREPVSSTSNPFTPPAGNDFQNIQPVKPQGTSTQPGGQPGLFGGTMHEGSCNKDQLVTFLEQNPDKGQAWASTLGVSFADLRTYVASLTPVLLRSDTRLTNHGWKNGQITDIQVVLQAGTAVLVDDKGFPVTKCYCGNPLTPPAEYPPSYTGKSWSWFDKNSLTVVTQNVTVIDIFVLVDVKTGQTFLRPRGTTGAQDTLQTPTTTTPPTTRSTPSTTRPPSTTHPPTTPPTTGSTTSTTHTPST